MAGALAGLVALLLVEPLANEAVSIEEARAPAEASSEGVSFDRSVQRVGLIVGGAMYGAAIGGILGLVYSLMRRRFDQTPPATTVAAVAFLILIFVPSLQYPPVPPGAVVESVRVHSGLHLAATAVSLLAAVAAWSAARGLMPGRSRRARLLAAGWLYAGVVTVGFLLLPPLATSTTGPAGALLWEFRVAALGVHLLLWIVLGVLLDYTMRVRVARLRGEPLGCVG